MEWRKSSWHPKSAIKKCNRRGVVCCAANHGSKIFSPSCELRSVHEKYNESLLKPTDSWQRQYGYFLQDNATANTTDKSTVIIYAVFKNRKISKVFWPPRSPNLNVIFISGETWQEKCMRITLTSLKLSRMKQCSTASVSKDELQKVSRNLFACYKAEWAHFQQFLFIKYGLCCLFTVISCKIVELIIESMLHVRKNPALLPLQLCSKPLLITYLFVSWFTWCLQLFGVYSVEYKDNFMQLSCQFSVSCHGDK